jgi:G3E family GTPase
LTRIPTSLITGFLGSGKTTLLNRLLKDERAAQTAVVVNEFGEIGLDHELIEDSDDTVVLLEGGCLCCQVRGNLVDTLVDLVVRRAAGKLPPFRRLAIETSGLADPKALIKVILAEPVVSGRYSLDGIIATIDAVNGAATLDAHPVACEQAALADRLVLTKTDVAAPPALASLQARLAGLNPAALRLDGASFDPALLFEIAGQPLAVPADDHHHHDPNIRTVSIVRDPPMPKETLDRILAALEQNLGLDLLRVKGIVCVAEAPDRPLVVQAAQTLLHAPIMLAGWPSADRRTRLVVIARTEKAVMIEELVETIERLSAKTARLRPRPT